MTYSSHNYPFVHMAINLASHERGVKPKSDWDIPDSVEYSHALDELNQAFDNLDIADMDTFCTGSYKQQLEISKRSVSLRRAHVFLLSFFLERELKP